MLKALKDFLFGVRSAVLGDPGLVVAARELDVSEVRRLLQGGAAPDTRDMYEYTPLMRAVSGTSQPSERRKVIDLLLEAGAAVDAVDQGSQTALIHAAHSDAVECAKRLLAAGANAQIEAASGRDALQIAFEHGNLDLACLLAKAELALPPDKEPRVLVCAAFTNDVERITQEIEQRGLATSAPSWTNDGREQQLTPLHAAACAGHLAIAKLLLDAGADVNAEEHEGVTPLIQAARMGHAEIVKLLLERHADLEKSMRAMYSDDALSAAARHNHRDVVVMLLDAGVHPNGALVVAASCGHEAIVDLALERGASVDGPGPLCASASGRSVAIVDRLLKAGADPNARIEMPEHMISLAPLTNAISVCSAEIVARLVDAGADVNARDPSGDTPLLFLAEVTKKDSDAIEIAKTLIRAGADVRARGEDDRTALSVAEQRGLTRLATILGEAGAGATSARAGK